MSTKFEKLNAIKDQFNHNIETTNSNSFKLTESLADNFKKAFNLKTLAIASLLGLSVNASAADFQPVDSIQNVYEESLKTININYNQDLSTFSEIKFDVVGNRKDTMLKNDFWQNNVSTIVYDNIDDDLIDENDIKKYGKNLAAFSENSATSGAFFIKKIASQEKVNDIYGDNDYKYYFQADENGAAVNILTSYMPREHHSLFKEFIVYHEMAHGSYEQEISTINKHATFDLSTSFLQEVHSDVAGTIMTAKKNHLSAQEASEFISEVAKVRANHTQQAADVEHNTTIALLELSNAIKKNPSVYDNLFQEKISSFSAYFAHNLNKNFDKKIINDSFSRIGFETDIAGTKDRIVNLQNKMLQSGKDSSYYYNGDHVFDTLTYNDVFEAYILRGGDELKNRFIKTFNDYFGSQGKNLTASIELNKIHEEFRTYIAESDNRELDILAVNVSKKTQSMEFHKYSNMMATIFNPENLPAFYKYNSFNDTFNNKSLNKIISKP